MQNGDGMNVRDTKRIWSILESVPDPEIPAVSIVDLGIVRDILWEGERVTIIITPTYSGCPAMKMIEDEILAVCRSAGLDADVKRMIAPAWSTSWISEQGRRRLRESGITPPLAVGTVTIALPQQNIECPFCEATATEVISEFGSTACKSLYRCRACGAPFDYFKPF
jgi:ring-1,2-phenylacetyl-CoA epoxidase subunit PaaD